MNLFCVHNKNWQFLCKSQQASSKMLLEISLYFFFEILRNETHFVDFSLQWKSKFSLACGILHAVKILCRKVSTKFHFLWLVSETSYEHFSLDGAYSAHRSIVSATSSQEHGKYFFYITFFQKLSVPYFFQIHFS